MQYTRIISKRLLQFIGILLLFLLLWLGYLLASEYKPEPLEQIELEGRAAKTLTPGQAFSIVSWNMGYGGLDATVDFFMDGGQTVIRLAKLTCRILQTVWQHSCTLCRQTFIFYRKSTATPGVAIISIKPRSCNKP